MKAILIFNNVNDLIYSKWDVNFIERMKIFSDQLEVKSCVSDNDHVSQLMSPIITSQRVMAAQFGNTYSSMQCKDGTNIVFDEMLDHVLMIVTQDPTDDAQRELLDLKTFVQHVCGQNINLLQSSVYQKWLSVLLDSRTKGDSIPGASGVIGESGATGAAINALRTVSRDFKCASYQHYHLMLYVGDKLLALYSSRGAEDLTPPDIILLSIQCIAAQEYWDSCKKSEDTEETHTNSHLPWLSEENSAIVHTCAGASGAPCAPHAMFVTSIAPRIIFACLVDMDIRDVGVTAHLSNHILANLRRLLLQRNLEMLPTTIDSLETSLKKLNDALRKNKSNSNICARLTSRMNELKKSCTTTTPLTPETAATAMHTALETVIETLRPDIPRVTVESPVQLLTTLLSPYVDFLCVKADRYFSLSSCGASKVSSLTLHKYLDEFPGLIHFVYVDRTKGRFIAPDVADCKDLLTHQTVRSIISRGMQLAQSGMGGATWRAGGVHAVQVQWFERAGVPVAPRTAHVAVLRALPTPGDITGAFYKQLVEQSFPSDANGVSVKELVCIHLGLLPASTAVQQAKRLAHTVHEFAGENRSLAADLM